MPRLTAAEWRFCGRWVGVTAATLALCGGLGPLGLLIGPVTLATGQALTLRRIGPRPLAWGVTSTLAGYGAIALYLVLFLHPVIPLSLMILICGVVLSGPQAGVLQPVSQRWLWWIPLSAGILWLSLSLFMPLAMDAAVYGSQRSPWQWGLLTGLSGLVGGFLKALALIWVLRSLPPSRQQSAS